MTETVAIDIGRTAILTGMQMATPVLVASMAVGAVVAIVLAATQIQEFTLTFIPKIAAVAAAAFICGPWMMRLMVAFTTRLFTSLPQVAP
jgi:flagellar biosynthetic protein FliQ